MVYSPACLILLRTQIMRASCIYIQLGLLKYQGLKQKMKPMYVFQVCRLLMAWLINCIQAHGTETVLIIQSGLVLRVGFSYILLIRSMCTGLLKQDVYLLGAVVSTYVRYINVLQFHPSDRDQDLAPTYVSLSMIFIFLFCLVQVLDSNSVTCQSQLAVFVCFFFLNKSYIHIS